jgi:hypothetical protein
MAITIDQEKCVGCGCCSDVCAQGALELDDKAVVNEEFCIECGVCIDICPALAIEIE